MKRYDKAELFELSIGDRFHFAGDKKMKVLQVTAILKTNRGVISVNAVADNQKYGKDFKTNKSVVFLRKQMLEDLKNIIVK